MSSNVQKIIAIGGGEIGRPRADGTGYYPVETSPIDKEILRLTNSQAPSMLFIPTASNDSKSYFDTVKKHFLDIGFASVDVLYWKNNRYYVEEIVTNDSFKSLDSLLTK